MAESSSSSKIDTPEIDEEEIEGISPGRGQEIVQMQAEVSQHIQKQAYKLLRLILASIAVVLTGFSIFASVGIGTLEPIYNVEVIVNRNAEVGFFRKEITEYLVQISLIVIAAAASLTFNSIIGSVRCLLNVINETNILPGASMRSDKSGLKGDYEFYIKENRNRINYIQEEMDHAYVNLYYSIEISIYLILGLLMMAFGMVSLVVFLELSLLPRYVILILLGKKGVKVSEFWIEIVKIVFIIMAIVTLAILTKV